MTDQQAGIHPVRALSAHEGRAFAVGDALITIKLGSEDTDGAFSLIEHKSPPGHGSSFHTHPWSETFYVLDGEYEFYSQDADAKSTIAASQGATVHIPANAPHGFKNVSNTAGRVLDVMQPAGHGEVMVEELGIPVDDLANLRTPSGPPDREKYLQVLHKHGVQII